MKLSEAVEKVNGLRYIVEELDIISAPAKRLLYSLHFLSDERKILSELNDTKEIHQIVTTTKNEQIISLLKMKLMQVKDIHGTIQYIKSKNVKDDIEFFELKHFSMLSESIREYVDELNVKCINIPNLTNLIDILDPEDKKIPSFYIYDAYSEKLTEVRKEYAEAKNKGDEELAKEIKLKSIKIEDEIRKILTEKIRPFADDLFQALHEVAKIDLLIAKSYQITRFNLNYPTLSKDVTSIKEMFNPQIDSLLREKGKRFQPVDINVLKGVTLIVGANMAGKSVLLKTVALVQYLFQFGFYVPCSAASIIPVEAVYISLGDGQNEMKGLSSYGAEMLQLNTIIGEIEKGKQILVLLDELARTTNPTEGKAIVSSMIELLEKNNVLSLITTHYSGIGVNCNRLRVKGFREDKVMGKLNASNINDYMDYSLRKDTSGDVPTEAIRIAEILGVNKKLISLAKKYLEN